MIKLGIFSTKGGVGKSTLTRNLASSLKNKNLSVGIVDMDIYGPSQHTMLGDNFHKTNSEKNRSKLMIPQKSSGIYYLSSSLLLNTNSPMVWRAPIAVKIIKNFIHNTEWPQIDILLFDMPPGTGDIHITASQNIEFDGSIVVTTPQELACQVTDKGIQFLEKTNIPIIGLVENMSFIDCDNCTNRMYPFGSNNITKLISQYQLSLLGKIPISELISRSADSGADIDSNSGIGLEYDKIASNVLIQLNKIKSTPFDISILDGNLCIKAAGEKSIISGAALRRNCNCALCGKAPMNYIKDNYLADIKVLSFKMVGKYGIKPTFSDRHSTGIFDIRKINELV